MMKTEIKKMFREDGSRVQLINFLEQLPENNWVWSFLDFQGIGIAPDNLSMDEFEGLIRSDTTGFKMSWHQLLQFAESIEQTINCLLIAVKEINDLHGNELDIDNFSSCEIVIQAFDSTEWKLTRKVQ
ncbi:MAG: hypothetical protein Q8Q54_07485 [Methylococcales bacterium]|nr:hypothetical protein [Methylococcales bacterium]MDP3838747.1 hypothetical protein [Methylococcales bacterium]